MFNGLSNSLIGLAISAINLLPSSPVSGVVSALSGSSAALWLSYVNWFIPVGTILGILSAWLFAVAAYYVYQILLRWIKVVD